MSTSLDWSAAVLLATTPLAVIKVTSTTSGPRLVNPPRTWPGRPVIFDIADTLRVTRQLLALARLATREAPFVVIVGGSQPLRDQVSAALIAERPGLAFTWPDDDSSDVT